MKDGIREIVGKQITGVIVAKNEAREPAHQVFLVFGDGTHFEIYGNQFSGAGGIDHGDTEDIARFIASNGGELLANYCRVNPVPEQASEPVLKEHLEITDKTSSWLASYIDSWLLGAKYLFFICILLFTSTFCGILLAMPFIAAAERLGYRVVENRWLIAGVVVAAPGLFGVAFSETLKFFTTDAFFRRGSA